MDENDPLLRELVKRVDIFQGLNPADVGKIFSRGMTMNVGKGDTLFHKGTVGSQMYVVLGGTMGVYNGPTQVGKLQTGDTFGEMSLLSHEPRSATVSALEPSKVFVLSENVFQKLLTKRVAIQMLLNIARMLGKRLRDANMALRESEGR